LNRAYDILRSGAWVTPERIRLVCAAILCVCAASILFLLLTADGRVDLKGRPLGTDFASFYSAGTFVLDGNPQAPYDLAHQEAREQAILGAATPLYSWFYPPFFLFVTAALALLPYGAALVTWLVVTLALYLLMIWTITGTEPRIGPPVPDAPAVGAAVATHDGRQFAASGRLGRGVVLLVSLSFPAVLVNLGHGQNGFLTAALLGGALATLRQRPIVAGLLFGLLAYKPQFGLMIPLALAAGGYWRCFIAAAAAIAVFAVAATAAFGLDVWRAFFDSTHVARTALEQGGIDWYKMQSLFAWARMWGAPVTVAYVLQVLLIACLAGAVIWLWRSHAPFSIKAASLCLATVLATPFTFDYDMMVLAPAIAFLAMDGLVCGFGPWEKSALAALWLMPFIARSVAQLTLIPLGVPTMLAIFILLLHRSAQRFAQPLALSDTFLLK
jgi:alpha-1,2-mannosyltransferase